MRDASPSIQAFFDEPTHTVSYLVADPATRRAAVIDPVLDYDAGSGEVDTKSMEAILGAADAGGLTIKRVLEIHAHADHLSGAPFLKQGTGAISADPGENQGSSSDAARPDRDRQSLKPHQRCQGLMS